MTSQRKLTSPAVLVAVGAGLLGLAVILAILARSEGSAGTTATPLTRPARDDGGAGFASTPDVRSSPAPVPLVVEGAAAPALLAKPNAAPTAGAIPAKAAAAQAMRDVDVVVVDGNGRPVVGATVSEFLARSRTMQELIASGMKPDRAPTRDEVQHLLKAIDRGNESDFAWDEPVGVWTSGADGMVRIRVPAADTPLVATHAELGSSGVVTLAASEKGKSTEWVRLELAPRGTIEGVVLDREGRPAPGSRVVFESARMMMDESHRPRVPPPALTDGAGRFTVAVDTPYMGQVHAIRDGETSLTEWARLTGAGTVQLELRMPGHFAVTGLVLGPDGAPVPKARVDVAGWTLQVDEVVADEAGRFRLDLNSACHALLVAETDDFIPAEGTPFTLSEAQPVVDVVLRLIDPVSISGRVQWADGTAAARQMIHANAALDEVMAQAAAGGSGAREGIEDRMAFAMSWSDYASSDTSGRFVLDSVHPDVAMDLTCRSLEGAAAPVDIKGVRPGSADVLIVLERLGAGGKRLHGRAIDAETGLPLARYELRVSYWKFDLQPYGHLPMAVDAVDGRFELDGLEPAESYRLIVEAVGYPAQDFGPFSPGPDADLELRLGRHASLSIFVADESGAAQPAAHVQLMADGEAGLLALNAEVTSRETGGDGRLVWSDLRPGTWTPEAAAGDRRSGRQALDLPPGRQTSLVLTVGKPLGSGALELVALRSDGLPIAGAVVKAMQAEGGEGAQSSLASIYHGVTDDAGRLRFGGLQPGAYYVGVLAAGNFVATRRFEVAAGETVQLTLSASQ